MACSPFAMEALHLHASFHHRHSSSLHLLPHLPYSHRTHPSSSPYNHSHRRLLHVLCKFSGPDKDQNHLHGQSRGQEHASEQKQKVLSKFRDDRRKKRSFRSSLRARFRILQRILLRWSLSALLRGLAIYNRTHQKQVALSTLMACAISLGLLCLKITSVPSPHSVHYSDLVRYLDSGTVSSVLFEEGSRQVLFNMKSAQETSQTDVESPSSSTPSSELRIVSHTAMMDNDDTVVENSEMEILSPLGLSDEMRRALDEDMSKHLQSYTLGRSKQVNDEMANGIDTNTASQIQREMIDPAVREDVLPSSSLSSTIREKHDIDKIISGKKEWEMISALGASFKSIFSIPEQMLKTESQTWQYVTRRVENDEAYLLGLMREKGVSYRSAPQPVSASLRATMFTILSLWIPLAPLFWLMYKQFSSGNSSNQKKRLGSIPVKFEDVAGVDEAKIELVEIVLCLRGAMDFKKLGAKLPKGVLLVGPPGTGKTLLARAVAGEAGVPFFAASASEFVEMFVGRGAARIRELFSNARKCSPSIIFIDELDAVGGRRGRSFNDERDQTLNQLLTEMDGFESETGVLVIAATNRAEALDPALCRPGRFSRKVFVKEPDLNGRQQILAVHMRGIPIEGDVKAAQNIVALMTVGFVGADLANVVNEAALLAVRTGREAVTIEDLKEAVDRVKFGVGNKPTFSGAVERVIDWLQQPKALKPTSGYEAPSWNG